MILSKGVNRNIMLSGHVGAVDKQYFQLVENALFDEVTDDYLVDFYTTLGASSLMR